MNKIFKIIWNHATQTFVVTSELSKTRAKSSSVTKDERRSPTNGLLNLGTTALVLGVTLTSLDANAAFSADGGSATGYRSIAIGQVSSATGTSSTAIGTSTRATGLNATAIGYGAAAIDEDAIAIGSLANSSGNDAVAIGTNAQATQLSSTAVGANATAIGLLSVAYGQGAEAKANYASALGSGSVATATNASALGSFALAEGIESTAVGAMTSAVGLQSTALGYGAEALANNTIAIGNVANATKTNSIAVGNQSKAADADTIAIGNNSMASAVSATALGDNSLASGGLSTAIGTSATSTGLAATSIGVLAKATADGANAMGFEANASNNNTVAVGTSSIASGPESTALGYNSTASAQNSMALGSDSIASATSALAVGVGATATADSAVAIGNDSNATGQSAVAIGESSNATGTYATAVGDTSTATGSRSVALGIDAKALNSSSMALGDNAIASQDNSVALGSGSTTSVAVNTNSAEVNGVTYSGFAGNIAYSVVSVGNDTQKRQIQNVAAGRISADSTDAINGSQLYVVANNLTTAINVANSTANAANTTANTANATVNKGWNITSAQTGSGNAVNTIDDNIQMGETLTVEAGDNINITQSANKISIATSTTPTFNTVTTQNFNVQPNGNINMGGNVITNVGAPVNNTDAANKEYVDNGRTKVTSTDNSVTVNYNQATNTYDLAVDAISAINLEDGKNTKVNNTGTAYTVDAWNTTAKAGSTEVNVTANVDTATNTIDYTIDLSESAKNNITTANNTANLANNTANTANNTANVANNTANSALQTVVTQIDGTDVKNITKDNNTANFISGDNIELTADNEGIKISTSATPTFTNVTVGNTTINNEGLTINNGPSITNNGIDAANTTISNVKDGKVEAGSKEAVNGGQLFNATSNLTNAGLNFVGNNASGVIHKNLSETLSIVGELAETVAASAKNIRVDTENGQLVIKLSENPTFTTVTTGNTSLSDNGLTINNGPSITNNGIDAGNKVITNVSAGTNGTDAVNLDQLNKTAAAAKTELSNGSTTTVNTTQGANGQTISTVEVNKAPVTINSTTGVAETNTTGDINNSFTTVGDVVNALNNVSWTIQGNGVEADKVTAGNQVNFVNGTGTTAQVTSDGTQTNVTFNVNKSGLTVSKDGNDNVTVIANTAGDTFATAEEVAKAITDSELTSTVVSGNDNLVVTNVTEGNNTEFKVTLSNNLSLTENGSVTIGNTTVNNSGLTVGNVTVSNNGIDAGDNKVTGVADGDISPTSKDAINGSQLYTANQNIANYFGGNSTVDANGTITAPSYTITKTDGSTTTANSVGEAINNLNNEVVKPLTFAGDTGTASEQKLGSTMTVKGGITDESKLSDNNIGVVSDGNGTLTVKLAKDLNVSSVNATEVTTNTVKAGDTTIDSDGVKIANGPSVTKSGVDAAGTKITNVKAGEADTDAVNVSQLKAATNNVHNRINKVNKELRAGIAGANAAAGLPQVYVPGKSMVAAAAGTFKGESALAVGYSRSSDNGKVIFKLQGNANTRGDLGGSVGVGYQW
ncbi:YadA-like family protein [Actinobacillus vicugnae]|uniref:YadA-like family protein n=1 Tax=Actinobacillus vicugnae TaxID=2573093 RepID=UPI00123FB42D|nr:YadA-like family protein [Actinobacillus vicugnae]